MSFTKAEISAAYRSAIELISGQNGEPKAEHFSRAAILFQSIADISPAAKAKLAVLTEIGAGVPQDFDEANALFLAAAMSGFPPLLRELGTLLILEGTSPALGGMLLRRAASGGDWIAAFLILREAGRGRYFLGYDDLQILARQLHESVPLREEIRTSINKLSANTPAMGGAKFNVQICKDAISRRSLPLGIERHNLHSTLPEVHTMTAVLSPLACDYLIALSAGIMQPSKVVDAEVQNSISAQYRTSDGAVFLPHQLDKPMLTILWDLSGAAGILPQRGEFLSLLRYRPGQEYRPHHDYLEEDAADYSKVKACGQRCATLLTYLNTGYEGGETKFPDLGIQYKGYAGDSLYFSNTDAAGKPIEASRHAGAHVVAGEKWLATLWIREKTFWPWLLD